MQNRFSHFVGIDVSKQKLDVCLLHLGMKWGRQFGTRDLCVPVTIEMFGEIYKNQ